MKAYLSKATLMLLFLGLFLQSCSKDELIETNSEEFNNGSKGKPKQEGDIAKLNSSLIQDWTDLFLELDRYSTGMRPNATARAIAYIQLAVYETAIPGMRSHRSNTERLDGLSINDSNLPNKVDYRIAINACYSDVINHFLLHLPTDQRAKIEILEEENREKYSSNQNNSSVSSSIEWGEYVAQQIIAYSQTDLAAEQQILEPQPTSYEPPTGDGYWTYSADQERALFPYWESVRTFVIAPSETTTIPPIQYDEDPNSEYFAQMQEVYDANNEAKEQEGEQLWIAEFWSDDVENLMMSPPGRQLSIANQLVGKSKMNMQETLTMLVKLGFALNDGAVSTWKYKYQYMVMRPTVYVHEFIDADYQTNLFKFIYWPNPSFPGYPSGHSCFASAAAGVFIDYFGNNTKFTDRTHEGRTEFLGEPRQFNTLEAMAFENAFSRIPLGVHVGMDCEEGLRLGYEISDAVNNLKLKKNPT